MFVQMCVWLLKNCLYHVLFVWNVLILFGNDMFYCIALLFFTVVKSEWYALNLHCLTMLTFCHDCCKSYFDVCSTVWLTWLGPLLQLEFCWWGCLLWKLPTGCISLVQLLFWCDLQAIGISVMLMSFTFYLCDCCKFANGFEHFPGYAWTAGCTWIWVEPFSSFVIGLLMPCFELCLNALDWYVMNKDD